MLELLLSGFATLFVIIDPLGLVPIFLALTTGESAADRRRTALRAIVIAFAILLVFALTGLAVLDALGISLGAFRVAGGLFLFAIGFELVFERRSERRRESGQRAVADQDDEVDVAAFPMAIPLMAGPGAIAAVILLSGNLPGIAGKLALIGLIVAVLAAAFACLAVAARLDRILGATGRVVISRLLGVMLAALAVQFVADGAAALIAAKSGLTTP